MSDPTQDDFEVVREAIEDGHMQDSEHGNLTNRGYDALAALQRTRDEREALRAALRTEHEARFGQGQGAGCETCLLLARNALSQDTPSNGGTG